MDQRNQVCDGAMTRRRNAAIYVRVSTAARSKQSDAFNFVQNLEVQEQPLRELVLQRGWHFQQIYSDRASGAKEKRPGLNALMSDARRGLFDVVVVWRFDRFARSVKQLVLALEEFRALGIDFVSHQESLDSSTPMGRAMFTIIAAIAELERNIIRTRRRGARIRSYKWHAIRQAGRKTAENLSARSSIRASKSGHAVATDCQNMWCRGHDGPPRLPVDESQTRLAKTGRIGFSQHCSSSSGAETPFGTSNPRHLLNLCPDNGHYR
jgi:DNA invertase Pin-like site-specific DNA recombinase